jgi:hypothetical protein
MKASKRPFKKIEGVSYRGQTELTEELLQILQHFELIAFVKACGKNVMFYIVGQKPQSIEGRFKDIVSLLRGRKSFLKIHCSFMVNLNYVFVWAPHNDGLRLLMLTEQNCLECTILTVVIPDDIAASKLTPDGVNKAELAIRLGSGHILPVSESYKGRVKEKIKKFPYVKPVWQTIGPCIARIKYV